MKHVRFFIYQFILFGTLLVLNVYSDKYISKPFTRVDLIAICISAPIAIIIVNLVIKVYLRFNTIRLRNTILLSILAIISAFIFIGLMESIWFEIKGHMLFS